MGEAGQQLASAGPAGDAGQARRGHPVRSLVLDIAAPAALFYGLRGAGVSLWLALAAGGILPVITTAADLVSRRRADAAGLVMLAALAVSAALSAVSGSPRALLARDGLVTAGWAGYMYLSLLGRRPATFTVSRPLLEGRRIFDSAARSWVRPAAASWDELWDRSPRFRRIWRACTVIWGTAILADAVARVLMAAVLPVSVVPALGAALWPVTFAVLQVVTNVWFARAGLWRILIAG